MEPIKINSYKYMNIFENKTILATGGTGSFKYFVLMTLKKFNPKKIIIF